MHQEEATPAACAVHCADCAVRRLCLPMELGTADVDKLDHIVGRRFPLAQGELLYRTGSPFASLYAVREGQFKAYRVNRDGSEQVTGFHFSGQLLGLDAIGSGVHSCEVVALQDCSVCELPFADLEALLAKMPALRQQFHRMVGEEIARMQSVVLLLGKMKARQRLATLIVRAASVYEARGYSIEKFQLRMTHEDLSNYLGMTRECVSRQLTKFKQEGLVKVAPRELEVLDLAAIKTIAAGKAP
ncbi:fumarate/nitrate reduction transcriptional regulator Fnr [Rugamonas sp. CCM 8940]|uniref:fumarate/nitrate reduction transcriptional regulator Fnr n=1 Tax=Rugamonas sp. CCM 8940 TaxID=2765359 RepID=UPI0018F33BBC|nr:fumarate/nitrate reduction transcriptional regulator Fnr [Rugamonas sp. CCM 8940]MBJ7314317.1 fumarate/nitrate reduction transcriptional regulator Fnr [Rugamonas sp. CCM 8940]